MSAEIDLARERLRIRWAFAALIVLTFAGAHVLRAFDDALGYADYETRALRAEAALDECRRWTP